MTTWHLFDIPSIIRECWPAIIRVCRPPFIRACRHFLHVQIVSFIHISGGETPKQCKFRDETDDVDVLFTYTYDDFNQAVIKVQRRDMN
jgi:hypothetical protein